jgi:hypothetical protein
MPGYFIHCSPVAFQQILTVSYFISIIILLSTVYTQYLFYLAHDLSDTLLVCRLAYSTKSTAAQSHASPRKRCRWELACVSSWQSQWGPRTAAYSYGCTLVYLRVRLSMLVTDTSLKPFGHGAGRLNFGALCANLEYTAFESHNIMKYTTFCGAKT